ncbi:MULTISPECIES: amidohydrolase family protein [Amycolatopsis]|uniref:Amidohydrolase family protein n=1 Tax=Amycolatopsis albidoflavus TaxID=102226 RepID=A0ABW5HS77_9PSEU
MSTVGGGANSGITVLRAARIFDGEEFRSSGSPVVILEGAKISGVGCAADLPNGQDVVDFAGAALIPGLVDPHVHLAFDASSDPVASLAGLDNDAVLAAMRIAARTALRSGITTVRDLGDRDYLSLALRGAADLPTIVAAGPPITSVNGHCHFLGGEVAAGSPAELRSAVRAHAERGVDVIKIMASGGTMTPGSSQERAQFTREALHAAIAEAHLHGIPVTAHAHGLGSVLDAVDAGADGLEHVTFWSAEGVDVPGHELVERIVSQRVALGATAGVLPRLAEVMPAAVSRRMPQIIANFAAMYAAGATIVAGTDAGIGPYKPHDVLPYARHRLAAFGMDPTAILRSMTSIAARVCGLGHRKGRLKPGYDADVVVVRGDPLADLSALHRVEAVYSRGVRVDPEN